MAWWSLSREARFLSVLMALMLGTWLQVGCTKQPNAPTDAKTTSTAKNAAATQQQAEIEDQLKSGLHQLQPENLNIDSRIEDAVSVLNNWWAAVTAVKLEPTGLVPPEPPADRLDPKVVARLTSATYDAYDARHLRQSYLAKRIMDQVTAGASDDLDRVRVLFEWVCRNVMLTADDAPSFPATFYETVITGRGLAVQRAIVMAELLRQLRIDSCVYRQESSDPDTAPWLMAAVVDNQTYLFDFRLSLPLGNPATPEKLSPLSEVVQHPEWLTALAPRSDQPYDFTVDQLQTARIDVISPVVSWSAKMWRIEQMLPGDLVAVIYDPPSRLGELSGVFERVSAGTGQPVEKLGLWKAVLDQEARFLAPPADDLRRLENAFLPFVAPVEMSMNKQTQQPQRVETMRHLKVRTAQLEGRRGDSISQYVTIRQLAVNQPADQSLLFVHQRAAEDALYWSAVCKLENEERESAIRLFNDYLKLYRTGLWAPAARNLVAQCYAAERELDKAQKVLKTRDTDDPYAVQNAILLKRWTAADKPADKPEATAPEKPTDKPADQPTEKPTE